ncbi:hypothetical protein WAI453_001765 [Rhynchosporium graminicola]
MGLPANVGIGSQQGCCFVCYRQQRAWVMKAISLSQSASIRDRALTRVGHMKIGFFVCQVIGGGAAGPPIAVHSFLSLPGRASKLCLLQSIVLKHETLRETVPSAFQEGPRVSGHGNRWFL